MRHLLTIIMLLASVSYVQAHCCRGGHHHCGYAPVYSYSPPPVYVVPYWAPTVYVNPIWVNPAVAPIPKAGLREITPPPRSPSNENLPPKIANPKLPVEDIEPKKILPAPKLVAPKKSEQAKPVEKTVSVDEFLIPAERKRSEAPAEVKVGIFNHSDREMELVINGESVKLPADQYVTLRMPRTFTWAVKGKPEKEVKVPADSDGLEIVFRR